MPTTTDEDSPNRPERVIVLPDPVVVRDLASALKLKWFEIIRELMDFEVFATQDSKIDFPTASALCSRHGVVARKVI